MKIVIRSRVDGSVGVGGLMRWGVGGVVGVGGNVI